MRITALLLSLLSFASPASADQAWAPWPTGAAGYVAAGFRHDDGGSLVVMCDTTKKLLHLGLIEPRANWQRGQQMKFMTRPDSGDDVIDSLGRVTRRDEVTVSPEDTTFHLNAMGTATGGIAVGTGEYARVFPAAGFRKAMERVLKACGDSW
jgi:hypothetical protein